MTNKRNIAEKTLITTMFFLSALSALAQEVPQETPASADHGLLTWGASQDKCGRPGCDPRWYIFLASLGATIGWHYSNIHSDKLLDFDGDAQFPIGLDFELLETAYFFNNGLGVGITGLSVSGEPALFGGISYIGVLSPAAHYGFGLGERSFAFVKLEITPFMDDALGPNGDNFSSVRMSFNYLPFSPLPVNLRFQTSGFRTWASEPSFGYEICIGIHTGIGFWRPMAK